MAEGINEGLGEMGRNAQQLASSMDRGVVSANDFHKALKSANGDYTVLLKSIISANNELKKSHRSMTQIGKLVSDLEEGSAEWVKNLRGAGKEAKPLNASFMNMARSAASASETARVHAETVANIRQIMKQQLDLGAKHAAQQKKITAREKEIMRTLTEGNKATVAQRQKLLDISKKMEAVQGAGGENAAAELKTLQEMLNVEEARLKDLESKNGLNSDNLKSMEKELHYLELQRKESERITEQIDEWNGGMTGVKEHAKGMFRGLTKMTPKQLLERQAEFKGMRGAGKEMGGFAGKAAQATGAVGEVLTGLMSKLAPMLAGAVATGVASAAVGLFKVANWASKIVAEQREVFQSLTEPVFNGSKFTEQADQFATQVHELMQNQKWGTTAEEWQGMFKGMVASGRSVQNLTKNLQDTAKVQDAVKSTSLLMGVSLEEAGRTMQEFGNEYASPIEKIQKEFRKAAGSAKFAGLQAGHFMNIVNQSTLALSSYGKFIDVATGALTKFTRSRVVGDKTAAQATEQMMGFFGENMQENLAKLSLAEAGGKGFSVEGAWQDELAKRRKALANTEVGSDEWKRQRSDIATMENIGGMQNAGDRKAAMAKNAKFLSGQLGNVIKGIMASYGVKGGVDLASRGYLLQDQIPAELLTTLTKLQASFEYGFRDITKVVSGGGQGSQSLKAFMSSTEMLDKLAAGGEENYKALYKMVDELQGVNANAKASVKMLMDSPEQFRVLAAMVAKGQILDTSKLADLALSAATSTTGPRMSEKLVDQGAQVEALTDIDKKLGITKDFVTYAAASSAPLQELVKLVSSILDLLNRTIGRAVNAAAGAVDFIKNPLGGGTKFEDVGTPEVIDPKTGKFHTNLGPHDNGGLLPNDGYYKGHAGEMVLDAYSTDKFTKLLDRVDVLKDSMGGKSAGNQPVRVANVTVNVTGVSGDEVVKAINRHFNNAQYWNGQGGT